MTVVEMTDGATGTLRLTEPVVTIIVPNGVVVTSAANIELASTVTKIIFDTETSFNNVFGDITYNGTGSLMMVTDQGVEMQTLNAPNADTIDFAAEGTTGYAPQYFFTITTVTGNINSLRMGAKTNVKDRILANVRDFVVSNDRVVIEGKYPGSGPFDTIIPSVTNIKVLNGGTLTVAPAAAIYPSDKPGPFAAVSPSITLAAGGSIVLEDGSELDVESYSNDYDAYSNSGTALQLLGNATIDVRDGSELSLSSGWAGAGGTSGHGIDVSSGALRLNLYEGATARIVGGFEHTGVGSGLAISGNATAAFHSVGNAPTLRLKDGSTLAAGTGTVINIERLVPGEMMISDESHFSILAADFDESAFTVGIRTQGLVSNEYAVLMASELDTDQPLYIYGGLTKDEPSAGETFTLDGPNGNASVTTDLNGYAVLPLMADGAYMVSNSGGDISFAVDISGGKFAYVASTAGVSTVDGGAGLRILSAPSDLLSFTAVQVDGASNLSNTRGVLLTFDKNLLSFPSGLVSANGIGFGTPTNNGDADGRTWFVPITDLGITADSAVVTVTVNSWNSFVISPATADVTIYRRGNAYDYTAVQVGGVSQLTDTTGILVTFDEVLPAPLTAGMISITGATVNSVAQQGGLDSKEWLISVSSLTAANGGNCVLTIADGASYPVMNSSVSVPVYRSLTKTVTYTAAQVGGASNIANSTGILLTFSEDVAGISAGDITVSNGITVDSVTDNNDADGATWLAEISGTVANGTAVDVTVSDWTSDAHYAVTGAPVQVALYKDNRPQIDFSLLQEGGDSGNARTKSVLITFTAPVSGLTMGDISLLGALGGTLTDVQGDGMQWRLTLTGIGVAEGETISVTIDDTADYVVGTPTKTLVVYQADTLGYTVTQIDGEDKRSTTSGLLVTFSAPVTALTAAEIAMTGADVISITNNGDTDDRTWLVNIDNITENGSSASVAIGGTDGLLNGKDISGHTAYVRVFRDEQVYFTAEQVGGVDNSLPTTGVLVKFTDGSGNPLEKEVLADLYLIGANVVSYTRQEKNVWLLEIQPKLLPNGTTIQVEAKSMNGLSPSAQVLFAHSTANVVVYRDDRISHQMAANEKGGKSGYANSARIELMFFPEITGLQKSDITVTGIPDSAWSLSDGNDGNDITWNIVFNDIPADKTPVTIKMNDVAGHRFWYGENRDDQKCTIYKDTRGFFTYTAEESGGVSGSIKTKGVHIVTSVPVDWKQMSALIETTDGMEYNIYFEDSYITSPRSAILPLNYARFINGDLLTITLKPFAASTMILQQSERTKTFQVYDVVREIASRHIIDVMPHSIHKDSERKVITIVGNFGDAGAAGLREILFREKGSQTVLFTKTLPELTVDDYTASGTHHMREVDVSGTAAFANVGEYEVAFRNKDGFLSEYVSFNIVDDPAYSTDAHGILTVTQKDDRSFAVEVFSGESEMNAKKTSGTTLITFRGGVVGDGAGGYLVRGDSTLNKALQYYANTSEYIRVSQTANGVNIEAAAGSLKWSSMPIANAFKIELNSNVKYTNKMDDNLQPPMIVPKNAGEFNIVVFSMSLESYKLYEDFVSVAGSVSLSAALPLIQTSGGGFDATADLKEMHLGSQYRSLPPMNVTGKIDVQLGELFGSFMEAGGGLEVNINNLPSTNPRYFGLSGEVEVGDLVGFEGEFILSWGELKGKMLFIPDRISLGVSSEAIGIPLIPPAPVAKMTGVSGSINGLADTILGNYGRVPPVTVSLGGDIEDITGNLVEIEKARVTLGPSQIGISAQEVKLLKFLKITDVYYNMGARDAADNSIDLYIALGGHVGVLNDAISGELHASAELHMKYVNALIKSYFKDISGGNKRPMTSAEKTMLYNSFDVAIRARVEAKLQINNTKILGAYGQLEGSKVKLSGEMGVSSGNKELGLRVIYYIADSSFDVEIIRGRMARGAMLAMSEENETIIATNVTPVGVFGPTASARGFAITGGIAAMNMGISISSRHEGDLVSIHMHNKVDSIEVWKDGVLYEELIDPEWYETAEEMAATAGAYTAIYIIPEDGLYEIKASEALMCSVSEVAPIPSFESLAVVGNTASWTLNAAAAARNDLHVRLRLMDAKTGELVHILTREDIAGELVTSVPAATGSYTYTLPEDLPSGDYVVVAQLFENVTEPIGGEISEEFFASVESDAFAHMNTFAPSAVTGIAAAPLGNGEFSLSWTPVFGADGYRVTWLEANGSPVQGLEPIIVSDGTEISVQGGLFAGETEDGVPVMYGLDFDKTYTASVCAYRNKTIDSDIEGVEPVDIPVYGDEGRGNFTITKPLIPTVTAEIVNGTTFEQDGIMWHGVNNHTMTIALKADAGVTEIKVYDNQTDDEVGTISGSSGTVSWAVTQDGRHSLRAEAKTGMDIGYKAIPIFVDTERPVISVDGESFHAINGAVSVHGYTEATAQVFINGEEIAMTDTSFVIEDRIASGIAVYQIVATDWAGNTSVREVPVIYVSSSQTKPTNPTNPSETWDAWYLRNQPHLSQQLDNPAAEAAEVIDNNFTFAGYGVTVPSAGDWSVGDDGTLTLPRGGEIASDGMQVRSNGKTTVSADGDIWLRAGASAMLTLPNGARITLPDGSQITAEQEVVLPVTSDGKVLFVNESVWTLRGGSVLLLDETAPLGYRVAQTDVFEDVLATDWFSSDVAFGYAHSLFIGTDKNRFSPQMAVTRGMVVKMLGSLAKANVSGYKTSSFDDVDMAAYYAPYVEWARDKGIVMGVGDNKFAPGMPVSRQDLAVILHAYMRMTGVTIPASKQNAAFADAEAISSYAADAVDALYSLKLVIGKPADDGANIFDPKGQTTRAEMASIWRRFVELLANSGE